MKVNEQSERREIIDEVRDHARLLKHYGAKLEECPGKKPVGRAVNHHAEMVILLLREQQ